MKENNSRSFGKWLLSIGFIIALVLFFVFPTKYYIEVPGSAESLKDFVTVNDKTDQDTGDFLLTTVGIKQGTPFSLLLSKFFSYQEIVSREDLMGDAKDKEYNRLQQYFMDSSINHALEVAYKKADQPYELKYKGIYVMSLTDNSPLKGKINVGDTIQKIDGKSFENGQAFVTYVKEKKIGDKVRVTYEQNNKEKELTTKLVKLPSGQAGLGITLVDHTEIATKTPVKIDAGNIGGPSAGFMFTLEIYQMLTQKDLRHGLVIAGTGEMYQDGTIGRIGGIDKKIVAADKAGADIFLAPDDEITKEMRKQIPGIQSNYQEAKAAAEKINSHMKVVPVKNFDEAVKYLENLK